jgi:hypothetical protein
MPEEFSATTVPAAEALEGARNLLDNCVHVAPGDTVLVVREDTRHGYFDAQAPQIVEDEARARGARVLSMTTSRVAGPEDVPPAVTAAVAEADHTIFFNRIGDQMRFRELPGAGTKTITYALDVDTLGTGFCTTPHAAMTEFQALLQSEIDSHTNWHITCPLGTDISGTTPPTPQGTAPADFLLGLFPVTTFRPVPCGEMNGKVVLARWLNSSNTHVYEPEVVRLDSPVTAHVEAGRIVDFEGPAGLVANVRAHYDHVASTLGIDPFAIHSWHAGVNPRTTYVRDPAADPVRWNGMMFASPRYLHFHTCGDYAPGEIAWHILDPTVRFGDEVFWDNGELVFTKRPDVLELLGRHGLPATALDTCREIGL